MTVNQSQGEACPLCLNDGWVLLAGSSRRGNGPVYERGCAPCRWCEEGRRRYDWMKAQHVRVDDSYQMEDVVVPTREPETPGEKRAAKEAFRAAREVMLEMFEQAGARHAELAPRRASLRSKRQQSNTALRHDPVDA